MPLTPLHFGAGLFLGIISLSFLDFTAFLIGSVFPDIEPAFSVLANIRYPYLSYTHHGILHSFLGGIISALLIAIILVDRQEPIIRLLRRLFGEAYPEAKKPLAVIFLSALAGFWLHILFDSFTHYDVYPFWPSSFNPFLRLISVAQQRLIVYVLALAGVILLAIKILKRKNIKSNDSK